MAIATWFHKLGNRIPTAPKEGNDFGLCGFVLSKASNYVLWEKIRVIVSDDKPSSVWVGFPKVVERWEKARLSVVPRMTPLGTDEMFCFARDFNEMKFCVARVVGNFELCFVCKKVGVNENFVKSPKP